MSEIKVIKIDPLELSPHITWCISGLLRISLKDFVVYADDSENIIYINETKNIPQKDIDKIVELATCEDVYFNEEHLGFLDYIYKQYGNSAYQAIRHFHDARAEARLKQQAEQLAATIAPAIYEELNYISPNEMLVYYIGHEGDKLNEKTYYNMVGYNKMYIFMLGYLAGAGKINANEVLTIEENFDEEGDQEG